MCDLTNPIYSNPEAARKHLEATVWPDGPVCPHCGVLDKATLMEGTKHRPGLYNCRECRKQFTVTVGTVFERSRIPLNKWVLATHLLASSKKGFSAHQLHRTIGVTYKTAWFMMHRLREAMKPGANSCREARSCLGLVYPANRRRRPWVLFRKAATALAGQPREAGTVATNSPS